MNNKLSNHLIFVDDGGECSRARELCSICLNEISTAERVGLLTTCDHAFCYCCICDWRRSGHATWRKKKGCPICCKVSFYVVPSDRWVTGEARKQRIDGYISRCRYIMIEIESRENTRIWIMLLSFELVIVWSEDLKFPMNIGKYEYYVFTSIEPYVHEVMTIASDNKNYVVLVTTSSAKQAKLICLMFSNHMVMWLVPRLSFVRTLAWPVALALFTLTAGSMLSMLFTNSMKLSPAISIELAAANPTTTTTEYS